MKRGGGIKEGGEGEGGGVGGRWIDESEGSEEEEGNSKGGI